MRSGEDPSKKALDLGLEANALRLGLGAITLDN